jgi:excisionase family DNA binding protein
LSKTVSRPPSGSPVLEQKFLTVAEVATVLRVSKMTVYRLCHSGELEFIRVGRSFRILEASAEAYTKAAA